MRAFLTRNKRYLKWVPLSGFAVGACAWALVLVGESFDLRLLVVTGAAALALALGGAAVAFGVTILFSPELGEKFASDGWWLLWGPKDWQGREFNRKLTGLGAVLIGAALIALPVLGRL